MEEEKFDGLFLSVTQQSQGIVGLFNAFFGFLRRKTDYFSKPEEAQKIAYNVYQEQLKKYKIDQTEKKKLQEENDERERKAKELEIEKEKEKFKDNIEVKELSSNDKPVEKSPEVSIKNEEKKNEIEDKKENPLSQKEVSKDEKKESKKVEEEEDNSPPPIGNGGKTDKYIWTQTLSEVTINIPMVENVNKKMLDIQIMSKKIRIGIKSKPPIIDGEFPEKIKPQDTVWTLEDSKNGKVLVITVEKFDGMHWWDCAIAGDPKINTKKVQPENSKLSDLDGETRSTVEKMLDDQRRKQMGLPKNEEEQKRAMLKKFMDAHPEMDFSKAKIS